MKHQLFNCYQILILRYPWLSLSLTLIIIGYFAIHIPQLTLDASSDSLILEGDTSLKYYREINKRYDSEDFLVLTFRPQRDLFADQSLATLATLQAELATLSGIESVITILDVPLLQSPPMKWDDVANNDKPLPTLRSPDTDRTMARAELISSPIYRQLLISDDGQTTAIQINLPRDLTYYSLLEARESLREQVASDTFSKRQQELLAEAEKQFRDYVVTYNEQRDQLVANVRMIAANYRNNSEGAAIFIGGVPMIIADMISFIKSDLRIFGIGMVMFIIFTLTVIFRQLIWVVLPLATCLLNVGFVLGLMGWLDWPLTVISSNVVALLLIMTLAITIHLIVRYRELASLHHDWDQRALVTQTARLMAQPCLYTVLTTMVAFASLVVSDIRPVIDFGWVMTIGITSALIIAFIVLPTALLLLRCPKRPKHLTSYTPFTRHFADLTKNYGRTILAISVLMAIISAYGISRLEVENRFIDYFDKSTDIYQGMEVIDAQLGGTIPLDIIIDKAIVNDRQIDAEKPLITHADSSTTHDDSGFWDNDFGDFNDDNDTTTYSQWFNRAGLNRIDAVHHYLDSLPETGKVLSLATGYHVIKQLTTHIDDLQLILIKNKLPDEVKDFLISPYLDDELNETRITVRVMETSHTLRRAELLKQIHDHLTDDLGFTDDQVHLTGMLVLYNNMLQSLYRSQILTLGTVFIAILLMFIVLFRSLSIALLTIIPTILAASIVLGAMGLIGIPLDIMTVTIAAISVGIGVDNNIHYMYRFRSEFPKDNNYLATMYRCHSSIGKALFYTSITIIIGFSILSFSNFTPSIYFGLLTGSAMLAALIGALLLLPQLIITFKPFSKRCKDNA